MTQRARRHPFSRLARRRGRPAGPIAILPLTALVVGLVLVLTAGLLPALDPLLRPFGGLAEARANVSSTTTRSVAEPNSPSSGSRLQGTPLPVSPDYYPSLDDPAATVQGGWRDGTRLVPVTGVTPGQLDPLRLYLVTDASAMVSIPALAAGNCPASLPVPPGVRAVCSATAASNVRGDFPTGATALMVRDPGPATPFDGAAQGFVQIGGTPYVESWSRAVTSVAFGFYEGRTVLLLRRQMGDRAWTAYSPLDSSSAPVVDLLRRQVRGQDAPVGLLGQSAPTPASNRADSLYRLDASGSAISAEKVSLTGCIDPCFALRQWSGLVGYVGVAADLIQVYNPDGTARGQLFDEDLLLAYPSATAAPADGWEPYLAFQPFGARWGVPLSSPLGQELYAAFWSPTNGSWSRGTGFTRTQRRAMLRQYQADDTTSRRQAVSTAEYTYYTQTLQLPADDFVVKDSYTPDDVKNWIPVDTSHPAPQIADGERHYVVRTDYYTPVTVNPSTDATVRGVGLGVRQVGSAYRPTLVVQSTTGEVRLRDLNTADATTVTLFGQAYDGRLSRSRRVPGPNDTPSDTTPINTRTATTFVGTRPPSEVVRPLQWGLFGTGIGQYGVSVARTGFGWYQQVDSTGNPVGTRVKAVAAQLTGDQRVWLVTPEAGDVSQTAALSASLVAGGTGTPATNTTDFSGYSWGQAADFLSQRGIADVVATYQAATESGALTPVREKMGRAIMAKSILQNGHRFPFDNGGRNVLTPTEARDLFDPAKTDAAIHDALQNPAVLKDIAETTKDVAALADADAYRSRSPLDRVNISEPGTPDVLTLRHGDGTPATSDDMRMALRAAVWMLQEFRARADQATVTGFGATIARIKDRLADYYSSAANDVVNQALINALFLLHIDNDAVLAAFRQDPSGTLGRQKAAMRFFLDPADTGVRSSCATPSSGTDQSAMEYRTRYGGLLRYLESCNGSAFGLAAAGGVTGQVRQDYWAAAQRQAKRLTVQRGTARAQELAQQVLAVDAGGFASWSADDSRWAPVTDAVSLEATYLMSLLAKLDPALAATVASGTALNGSQDMFATAVAAGLSRDDLAAIASSALRLELTIVRLVIRTVGLASDTVALVAQALQRTQLDQLSYRLADIWREYGANLNVSDPRALEQILREKAPPENKLVALLNQLGAWGGVAGLMALGLIAFRFQPGHPPTNWRERMAIADAVFAAVSTASHQIRFFSLAGLVWGKRWSSSVSKVNQALGIGETPRYNWMLLTSDQKSFQQKVLTARVVVARKSGALTTGAQFKQLVEANHFTISDDVAQRIFDSHIRAIPAGAADAADHVVLNDVVQPTVDGNDPQARVSTSTSTRSFAEVTWNDSPETRRTYKENNGLDRDRRTFPKSVAPELGVAQVSDDGFGSSTADEFLSKLRQTGDKSPRSVGALSSGDWKRIEEAGDTPQIRRESLEVNLSGEEEARNVAPAPDMDAVQQLSDEIGARLKNGSIALRSVGIMIGLAVLHLMALCDFVGGVFQIVLSAWSLAHASTTEDRIAGSLNVIAGVAFLVAAVLEFVGTALATVVLLPLFIVGIVLVVVALLLTLLKKKHPDRDNAALAEWIEPYNNAGLLKDGWIARNNLLEWHSHSRGLDQSAEMCHAVDGRAVCDSTYHRRPLYKLRNGTGACLGVYKHVVGGRVQLDPSLVACDSTLARQLDTRGDTSLTAPTFGWEAVTPFNSPTSVIWTLLSYPGVPDRDQVPLCLSPQAGAGGRLGSMSCPENYTRGDGGAAAKGQWTVEWNDDQHTGSFRLEAPDGRYLSGFPGPGQAPALTMDQPTDIGQQWQFVS